MSEVDRGGPTTPDMNVHPRRRRRHILWMLVALAAGALAIVMSLHGRKPQGIVASADGTIRPGGGAVTVQAAPVDLQAVPTWYRQKGAPSRRIAGRVTSEGRPVEEAEVRLVWTGTRAGVVPTTVVPTDKEGRFDLGQRHAERYRISASIAGKTAALQVIDLRDPMASPAPDRLELRLTPCGTKLLGMVVDASGGPIEGARVERDATVGTTTNANGTFELCLPLGNSSVYVGADGYGGIILTVDGKETTRRTVVLVPEGTIFGRIVRAKDNTPVENAIVSAWPREWRSDRNAEQMAHSMADGHFELRQLAPGVYTVWGAADKLKGAVDVAVEASRAQGDIVVRLLPYSRITGHVTMNGKPVAGATVAAIRKSPHMLSLTAISQADGAFALEEVPLGDVSFSADPYLVTSPKVLAVTGDDAVDVVLDVEAMASVRGRVTFDGQPVAEAEVSSANNRGLSDEKGIYRLDGFQPGTHAVEAYSRTRGARTDAKVTLRPGEQKVMDLDLGRGATISGTVVDQDRMPVPNIYVVWSNMETDDRGTASTGTTGHYQCDGMAGRGRYRATLWFGRETGQKVAPSQGEFPTVELAGARSRRDGVDLEVRIDRLKITGRVVDTEEQPLPDTRVQAMALDPTQTPYFPTWLALPSDVTDVDGRFTIEQLAGGTYALKARSSDGSEGVTSGVRAGTDGAIVRVTRPGAIAGTLVGYQEVPDVLAQSLMGDFLPFSASVDNNKFLIERMPPGRYMLTVQTSKEGDGRQVDVLSGKTTSVTFTSRGSGVIDGVVHDLSTGSPVAGMACRPGMAEGGVAGTVRWERATAPRTGPDGRFTFDPAPAGMVTVYCYADAAAEYSSGRADVTLPTDGHAWAEVRVVRLGDQTASGDIGLDLDSRHSPPLVSSVRAGGPAALAGIQPADRITALNGSRLDGLTAQAVMYSIRNSEIGSSVNLSYRRGNESADRIAVVTVERAPAQ